MHKLTDTQSILLAGAAQRADGSLLPPPETIAARRDRIATSIAALIKRKLAEQVDVADAALAWRSEDDHHVGAIITDAGREAIGVEPAAPESLGPESGAAEPATPDAAPVRQTKSALVLALLGREAGATLVELTQATGWLPHTTRAALTGLREKGHAIAKFKREETTCYRIGAAA